MTEQTAEEKYSEIGLNNRVGYGNRPVVLTVDLQKGETSQDSPFGKDLGSVIEDTNTVIGTARKSEIPIIHTRIISYQPDGEDFGVWKKKVPNLKLMKSGSKWVELDERLNVSDSDFIVDKQKGSAFHETELNSILRELEIDILITCGCSTSGCIRASAIDACSHGYRAIIPKQCVGDHLNKVHEMNLFDMDAKYADVRPVDEVVNYLTAPIGISE